MTEESPGVVDDGEAPSMSDGEGPAGKQTGQTASSDATNDAAEVAAPAADATDAGACATLPLSRCECVVGETTTCRAEYASIGVCGERTIQCQMPGIWPPGDACIATSEELCTPGRLDDDCDGSVDEGCECIDGTIEGCGNSGAGVRTCAEGSVNRFAGSLGIWNGRLQR